MQALVVVVEERAHKTGTGGDPLRGKHLTDGLCCGFLPVHRAEGQSVQYAILCLLADGARMRRGIYPWHCVATGLRKEARKLLLPRTDSLFGQWFVVTPQHRISGHPTRPSDLRGQGHLDLVRKRVIVVNHWVTLSAFGAGDGLGRSLVGSGT